MEISKNFKIDVSVNSYDLHMKIIESIRLYRRLARQAYSICAMAQTAGSDVSITKKLLYDVNKDFPAHKKLKDGELEKLVKKYGDKVETYESIELQPNSDKAVTILDNAMGGRFMKGLFYSLRDWVSKMWPTAMYCVGEAIQRDVVSKKWVSKDPEKKITNGFLVINGSRMFAKFMNIGISIKNTIPKLQGHAVTIKWDYEIGPVEFRLGKMDSSTYYQWKCVRDGEWKLGTIHIKEKDNKLSLLISYTKEVSEDSGIDQSKTMSVQFSDAQDMFINCAGTKDFEGDKISVIEAVAGLESLRFISDRYDNMKRSAGNPRKVWGSRKIHRGVQDKISHITERRKNFVTDRNHLWSRRITNNARRWGCGRVVVINTPEGELFGHPWGWFDFKAKLEYKLKELGASVEFVKVET